MTTQKKNFFQKVRDCFVQHPHSIGESYFQHLGFAMIFGLKMVGGGLICILHSIFPFIFKDTGSNIVKKLAKEMEVRKKI